MKNKTQSRYVQGKFTDGETVLYVKEKGTVQQVKIVRLVQARFMSDGSCNVTYLVKDIIGATLNDEISEVRLMSADDYMEQLSKHTEYEWVKKDLKE